MSIAPTSPRQGTAADFPALRERIATRLQALLPETEGAPPRLQAAMRHALTGPGKRLRPLLTLLAARRCGGDEAAALEAGCAVEMVHTASLVLDDLPCMDDAVLRRGRPATHRAFGEDTAILAAIGLLNQAYGVMAALPGVPEPLRLRLVALLVQAVGPLGLVGGQERDLHPPPEADAAALEVLHHQKTGVLFAAALEAGAMLGGAPEEEVAAMRRFGRHLGLAFQTLDDVLDAIGTVQAAGKDVRQDGGKPSLVTLFGLEGARLRVREHLQLARREVVWSGRPTCMLEVLLDEVVAVLPLAGAALSAPLRDGPQAG